MGVCGSVLPEGRRKSLSGQVLGAKLFRSSASIPSNHHHHHHNHGQHHHSRRFSNFLYRSSSSAASSRRSSPTRSSAASSSVSVSELVEELNQRTESGIDAFISGQKLNRNDISPIFFQYNTFDQSPHFGKEVTELSNARLLLEVICFVKVCEVFHGMLTSQHCTSESCPIMSAGPLYEYRWRDLETGDVLPVGASSYINFLFHWTDSVASNHEKGFGLPVDEQRAVAKEISRRLFRVYSHLFHEHYGQICARRMSFDFDARLIHLAHFLLKHKMITTKELLPMDTFFNGKVRHHPNDNEA